MTQIFKKRETATRTVCPECDQGVRKGQQYTMIDRRAVHLFCASDAGLMETCTNCFFFKTDCECED